MQSCLAIAVSIAITLPAAQDEILDYTPRENQRSLWLAIKRSLSAPDGEAYFQENMKNVVIQLSGTILERRPRGNPGTLVLGISDPAKPEVTLKIVDDFGPPARPRQASTAQLKAAVPGSRIEFQGVAFSFTSDPFMLVLEVSRSDFRILKSRNKAETEKQK